MTESDWYIQRRTKTDKKKEILDYQVNKNGS